MLLDEYLSADSTTTAILMDSTDPSSFNPLSPLRRRQPSFRTASRTRCSPACICRMNGKSCREVTINYGARFDEYYSSFDKENQPSPRVNVIWQPTDSTTLHAGYARYFTPPPLENVPSGNVNAFDGTANESPAGPNAPDSTVKAERANYFDAGISQKITKHLQVGVDGYYKNARTSSTTDCSGKRSSSRRSIMPRAGFMAWNSPALTIKAVFPATPTSLGRRHRAKTGIRRNSCSIRMTRPMSKIIGSIWITTSASPARSAWLTRGTKAPTTARALF